jgi:transposase
MSRHACTVYQVPEETQRVARAAFPRGNPYMQVIDTLGTIDQDEQFAALFSTRGQPAEAPARLALVTVLQFAEGLAEESLPAIPLKTTWRQF